MSMIHLKLLSGLALLALGSAAHAHTGLGAHGIADGLSHPFGADHLLAMLAVGVWSVSALPASRVWMGPTTFMAALVVSAALGAAGLSVPFLEHAIALSVMLFGGMLMLAGRPWPMGVGLAWIAAAASLHGLAHGAEAPQGAFAPYALGFLATTGALHLAGVGLGVAIRRWLSGVSTSVLTGLGAALSFAGAYLFSQV
ncbi:MAG: HupE/UreJ family protein [Rhodoferax sp.]